MKRLISLSLLLQILLILDLAAEEPWKRHTIDNSSRGADGVRVADINLDGHPDFTTGWEEGGLVRVYLNPGPDTAKQLWPAVTVGNVKSPEDAVFADLDNDGAVDVVSSCEGSTQTVFVHWAPRDQLDLLKSDAWKTEAFPQTVKKTRWMFCLPMEVDGKNGIDLILGSKQPNAVVGWLESPANPRILNDWKWHPLYDAGWIMSLMKVDLTGDGREDVLLTDRKGPNRGLVLLEHPGEEKSTDQWPAHRLGGTNHEVMFLDHRRVPPPGWEIIVSTRDNDLLGFSRRDKPHEWNQTAIPAAENTGTMKSVRWIDVDLDGRLDLIYSCENAKGKLSGVVWMEATGDPKNWKRHEVSGPEGVKFDLIQLLDLDRDGDLDIITCEERANLGVIWYENPTR
ncbi:MAG: VCBS repeat-containing protein [Planctomycetaceae bacterium]|nr:VCBS repeat-containing protein [Planctomycetaceae bacterium]